MADCSGNGSRGHHKFTLNVWESYVSDGANNYSTVNWSLVLSPVQNGWDWNYSATVPVSYSIWIGGNNYTGNIMSYDGRSTVTVASGSVNIGHDSDGSKWLGFSFEVWDNVSANFLPGYASGSGSMNLTTIPRYASISASVVSRTVNSITIDWSTDANVDQFQYKLGSGSWVDVETNIDKRNGRFTVYGLEPNTSYLISFDAKRKDSQLWSTWGGKGASLNSSTYDIGRIASAPNINFGDSIRLIKPNPSQALNELRIEIFNPYQTAVKRTKTSDDMTITLTDEEWDNLYKCLGNGNSMTIRYVIDTKQNGSIYYDWVDRTLTLTGNQKTIRKKVAGSWKRGKIWIKVNGIWRRGVVWIKSNGVWRRSI